MALLLISLQQSDLGNHMAFCGSNPVVSEVETLLNPLSTLLLILMTVVSKFLTVLTPSNHGRHWWSSLWPNDVSGNIFCMCTCSPMTVSFTSWKHCFPTCLHVIIFVYKMCKAKLIFISSMCAKYSFAYADKWWLDHFTFLCFLGLMVLFEIVKFCEYGFCFSVHNNFDILGLTGSNNCCHASVTVDQHDEGSLMHISSNYMHLKRH